MANCCQAYLKDKEHGSISFQCFFIFLTMRFKKKATISNVINIISKTEQKMIQKKLNFQAHITTPNNDL